MIFKNSSQYNDIYNELFHSNMLDKNAEFVLYSENEIIYEVHNGCFMHEFVIISDSYFFPIEKCIDLLNKEGIEFISHTIYDINDNAIGNRMWVSNVNILSNMN